MISVNVSEDTVALLPCEGEQRALRAQHVAGGSGEILPSLFIWRLHVQYCEPFLEKL